MCNMIGVSWATPCIHVEMNLKSTHAVRQLQLIISFNFEQQPSWEISICATLKISSLVWNLWTLKEFTDILECWTFHLWSEVVKLYWHLKEIDSNCKHWFIDVLTETLLAMILVCRGLTFNTLVWVHASKEQRDRDQLYCGRWSAPFLEWQLIKWGKGQSCLPHQLHVLGSYPFCTTRPLSSPKTLKML